VNRVYFINVVNRIKSGGEDNIGVSGNIGVMERWNNGRKKSVDKIRTVLCWVVRMDKTVWQDPPISFRLKGAQEYRTIVTILDDKGI
jgi:hypothetical protein